MHQSSRLISIPQESTTRCREHLWLVLLPVHMPERHVYPVKKQSVQPTCPACVQPGKTRIKETDNLYLHRSCLLPGYSTPILIISASVLSIKNCISGRAKMNTTAEIIRQNHVVTLTALRMPCLIRAFCPAPKFYATNVEKAFPKSCTGM